MSAPRPSSAAAAAAAAAEATERRRRAFADIRQWGDPVLRTPTRPVEAFDDALRTQAAHMLDVLRDVRGAGLAAPQVGLTRRLLVYAPDADTAPRALVNPEVEVVGEEVDEVLEGCLSLGTARVVVPVVRPTAVVVRALDLEGTPVEVAAEGMHARVLQHEADHLDGVLMLDRTSPAHRRGAVRALREGRPYAPAPPAPEVGEAMAPPA